MDYETEQLEIMALEAIKKHKIVFFDELSTHMPCHRSTMYNHGLNTIDTIKEELYKNRVSTKVKLRKKWLDSESATTQIALYKLLADENEFNRLCSSQIDHTSKGESITGFEIAPPDED